MVMELVSPSTEAPIDGAPPQMERCEVKRVVRQAGYGEADLHCQVMLPVGTPTEHHRHHMTTEADGVVIRYSWRS